MKRIILFLILLLSTSFIFAENSSKKIYQDSKFFAEVLTVIDASYVEKKNIDDLTNIAVTKMVESLGDDFTQILSKEDYEDLLLETEGAFVGIGIQYDIIKGSAVLVTVYADTPASEAGLLINDILVKINDFEIKKPEDLILIPNKIRGKENSEVNITILRGDDQKVFKVKRKRIEVPSVELKKIDDIGYIKINEFTNKTAGEFEAALKNLQVSSLILDLRNNPGGLLDSAIAIIRKFAKNGKVILTTKGRSEDNQVVFKANEKAEYELPIVILVNEYTVSSAEVVAASLRDLGLATLIGQKTFGKASVQLLYPLSDGRAIAITTAKYYTPKGECIHKKGIEPDVSFDGDADADAILECAKNTINKILHNKIS